MKFELKFRIQVLSIPCQYLQYTRGNYLVGTCREKTRKRKKRHSTKSRICWYFLL